MGDLLGSWWEPEPIPIHYPDSPLDETTIRPTRLRLFLTQPQEGGDQIIGTRPLPIQPILKKNVFFLNKKKFGPYAKSKTMVRCRDSPWTALENST